MLVFSSIETKVGRLAQLEGARIARLGGASWAQKPIDPILPRVESKKTKKKYAALGAFSRSNCRALSLGKKSGKCARPPRFQKPLSRVAFEA